jgi:hypothetical protein
VICKAQGNEFAATVPEYAPCAFVVTACVNPEPFAHFAVIVPLTMAAPIAAVPLTVAVDAALLETEDVGDDETEEALLELNAPVVEEELDATALEDELLDARLLTLAADETELLDEDDDEDFLLSLSLQLTKSNANKIPAHELM